MKVKVSTLRFSRKNVRATTLDKKIKVKYRKPDYVKMLDDARRWPISMRIAAELWRNGIDLEKFENEFHLEENSLSKQVHESMVQFHLNKGFDPFKIAPARETFVRYVPPAKVAELNAPKGRPSTETVVKFIHKLIEQKKKDGWKEVDFIKGFRVIDDVQEDEIVKVKAAFEEEEANNGTKVRNRRVYSVLVGNTWVEGTSKAALLKAKEAAEKAQRLEPLKDIKSQCCQCKYPLTELVITVRKEGQEENMHFSCYWLKHARPETIPNGMEILNPKEGVFYVWKQNVGWVKREIKGEEKAVSTGESPVRISPPKGKENKQAAAVPASP